MDRRLVTEDKEDNTEDDMVPKTVCLEVKGFDQDNFDQEKFEMYFENPEIGGGPIKEIKFEGNTAFLTFEDTESKLFNRRMVYLVYLSYGINILLNVYFLEQLNHRKILPESLLF